MSRRLRIARSRAEAAARHLGKVAARVEVVGSVRRRRPDPKDIELLVEPEMVEADLFGGRQPDIEPIRRMVLHWGDEIRANGDRLISVVSGVGGAERVQWDVFLCHPPADWGVLEAIRTGPANLSRLCVTRLREKGWRCKDGQVWRPHDRDIRAGPNVELPGEEGYWTRVPCPTEEDFFEACEVPCLPPEKRDAVRVEPLKSVR